jgi:hypothetical protein
MKRYNGITEEMIGLAWDKVGITAKEMVCLASIPQEAVESFNELN